MNRNAKKTGGSLPLLLGGLSAVGMVGGLGAGSMRAAPMARPAVSFSAFRLPAPALSARPSSRQPGNRTYVVPEAAEAALTPFSSPVEVGIKEEDGVEGSRPDRDADFGSRAGSDDFETGPSAGFERPAPSPVAGSGGTIGSHGSAAGVSMDRARSAALITAAGVRVGAGLAARGVAAALGGRVAAAAGISDARGAGLRGAASEPARPAAGGEPTAALANAGAPPIAPGADATKTTGGGASTGGSTGISSMASGGGVLADGGDAKNPAASGKLSGLSKRVLAAALKVGRRINKTGGYRFDGVNDCYGFVRRTWDPILKSLKHKPLPVNDYVSPAWQPIRDWNKLLPGDVLATAQGHKWGPDWHTGLYYGKVKGAHQIYDNSGCHSGRCGAYVRPRPSPTYFRYYYVPTHALLAAGKKK